MPCGALAGWVPASGCCGWLIAVVGWFLVAACCWKEGEICKGSVLCDCCLPTTRSGSTYVVNLGHRSVSRDIEIPLLFLYPVTFSLFLL
jgi:hypothetical protein